MTRKDSKKMSRKDRERERHRGEILDAAEVVFIRNGYGAATVEEIAKQAEFAVGTLYLFFKGKDELYGCVIQRIIQEFTEQFEKRVLTTEGADEAIAALIELRLRHFDEHRPFFQLVFAPSPSGRVDPPPQCVEMYDKYIEAVSKLFQQGVSQGIFDEADPLYLALFLEGILNAFVAHWSRHPPTEPLAERVAKMKREFLGRIKVRLGDGAQ